MIIYNYGTISQSKKINKHLYRTEQLLSRGTFIHNKVLAKAQFELFLSIYVTCRGRE